MSKWFGSVRDISRQLVSEWTDDRVAGLSAEVAFYAVLSLFPGLLTLAGFLGLLQGVLGNDVADRAEAEVVETLQRLLTDEASDTIDAVRQLFSESSPGVLTFGALAAFWALSRGFAALIRALDVAYDVDEVRSWWRLRLTGLVMALGSLVVVVLLFGMLILGPLLGTGRDVADAVGAGSVFVTAWDVFRVPFAAAVLIGWAVTVFHFAPDHHTPWRWDIPGALLTAALWALGSIGFRVYLLFAAEGNQVFGVLGGALVVMLWFYVLSASLLIGAELNAILAVRWHGASGSVDASAHGGDERAGVGGVATVEQDPHDG